MVVRFRTDAALDPGQLVKFVGETESATLSPEGVVRINLDGADGHRNVMGTRRVRVKNKDSVQASTPPQTSLTKTELFGSEVKTAVKPGSTVDHEYLNLVQIALRRLSGSV